MTCNGMILNNVYAGVEAYYSSKLFRHGATPRGVDWSCMATQWLRFVQLMKICPFESSFSLIDLGCGYGALAGFLADRYPLNKIDYFGLDLSRAMVQRARRRYRRNPSIRFAVGRTCSYQADYVVASGIMNVIPGYPVPIWENFVRATLIDMSRMAKLGFAVNFLTEPTPGAPPEMLYCPDPATWIRFCQEELGQSVERLDNYGMREFTLLVRTR